MDILGIPTGEVKYGTKKCKEINTIFLVTNKISLTSVVNLD